MGVADVQAGQTALVKLADDHVAGQPVVDVAGDSAPALAPRSAAGRKLITPRTLPPGAPARDQSERLSVRYIDLDTSNRV